MHFSSLKSVTASFLLAAVFAGTVVVIPEKALAQAAAVGCIVGFGSRDLEGTIQGAVESGLSVPVIDRSNLGQNVQQTGFQRSLTTKEYCLDPAIKMLASTILQALAQAIIEWVQSGGNDNFVSNLQAALTHAADDAAGEFLNQLAGVNLCSPFARDIRFAFSRPGIPRFGDFMRCSATDIFNTLGTSYEGFLDDFTQGGWIAFDTALSGSNNYIDALINSYDRKLQAETRAMEIVKAQYDAGNGFLGVWVKKENCSDPLINNDEWIANPNDPVSQRNPCSTTRVQTTPGSLVSFEVNKIFGTGIDQLVDADELSEVIDALLGVLINKLIDSAQEGLADNDSDSGLNDRSIVNFSSQNDTIPPAVANVAAVNVTQTSASIAWDTSEPATSSVYYQTTSPVNKSSASSVSDGTLTTNHSLTVAGLTAGTTYYYFVESADAEGNKTTSSTQSFTTLP